MNLKLIKTEADHKAVLKRIDEIFTARPGSSEGDELELLVHLVEEFEEREYPIDLPDPVEAIRFRMEQQGLKNTDLVPFIGSKSKVSEVLHGKRPLSLAMIRKLHHGLGIPAAVLLREPGEVLSPVYEGINWNDFPLAEMIRRKWFPDFKGRAPDLCERAEEVLGPLFFPGGRDSRDMAMAARQRIRQGSKADENALWAWRAKVLSLAVGKELGEYDPAAMTKDFMRSVIKLSRLPDGPAQARRLLAGNGIAVVILHYLPGTHLDGAATLRADGHPVIALTLRHDRLDNFWFTLAHEMAHVVRHLAKGEKTAFIDDLEGKDPVNAREKEADEVASDLLIPEKEWKTLLGCAPINDAVVRDFAVRINVHPAIVAGRIRREANNYLIFSNLVGSGLVRKMFPAYKSGD
ncbi:MAG TPA: ImmA/IrrE family metallo-endopeptidase [Kiritimatiellia bacterium]|nr:ImmA/IrrE family metallo-endopeptidase [Kiritimatiellia bacterium]